MSSLVHAAHLLATDPAFRQVLEVDPRAALEVDLQGDPTATVAADSLTLNAEERHTLDALRQVLSLSPEDLRERLLTYRPFRWCE